MAVMPRTLPAAWYTDPYISVVERRAVFLKSWYFIGSILKFEENDVASFEIAQVRFTARKVAKAPNQVEIKVYDDATGGELQSHQTATGLIFTTISSLAPPFEKFFPGLEALVDKYDFTCLPLRRQMSYEGKYNWKTLIDGFQECLHCQYTHPAFSKLYPTISYKVINQRNWSRHFANPDRPDDGLFLFFFPNSTLNLYNAGMSSFRVCPSTDPGCSRMEFDYYHELSGQKFEDYFEFVRQVANEDFALCERAQVNLNKGVYSSGCLNPVKESGVIRKSFGPTLQGKV